MWLSENYKTRFNENLMKNLMDYKIPYGFILLNASDEALQKYQEIYDPINEIHESLSKGGWSDAYIEMLSGFPKPLDAVIDMYSELQQESSDIKLSMVDVVKQLLKKHGLLQETDAPKFTNNVKQQKPTLREKMKEAKDKVREAEAVKSEKGGKSNPKRDERS